MSNIDPNILATLTDEELAAIEGDDMTPAERAAIEELAGEDDADDAGDDAADDVDDGDGDDVDAGDQTSEVQPEAQAPAVAADPAPAVDPAPQQSTYRAELPSDFAQQVDALKAKTEELAESYKSGEIDFDEYRNQAAELQKQSAALERAVTKAEIAQELAEQNAQAEWQASIARLFADANKNDGIDYTKDAEKNQDLDTFVKALAANPANQAQSMSWFLNEAHKRVMALHGMTKAPASTPDPAKHEKPNRKPPIDALPKTLAQVPGGDGPGDVESEFTNIDSLDGEALEAAIARMTPAQRERYMAGA